MRAVAIDGPTGAGKTTLARMLARAIGFIYVDTGAMYRAIGHHVRALDIGSRDAGRIVACLPDITLELRHQGDEQRILLNGRDITGSIRDEVASRYASDVSAVPEVRQFLLETQRQFARRSDVIMEGRDIATVVLPQADVKVFLTATSQVRAQRRCKQLLEMGDPVDFVAVHRALLSRDYNDSHRAAAPLRPAPDGVILDTTQLTLHQAFQALHYIVEEKIRV